MLPTLHHVPAHHRVPHETNEEIDAYNAAFEELGLDWRWDRAVMRELAAVPIETARVATYLKLHRPHLLHAYPAEFLAELIVATKHRLRASPREIPHGAHAARR